MDKDIKKIYGPYKNKLNRLHIIILYWDNSRETISYPKWIMEQHLGRKLDPVLETIDHINRDFTDNRIENLRIVPLQTNVKDDVIRVKDILCTCVYCGKTFYRKPSYLQHNSKLKKAGPFCSRECVGKYGQEIQCNKRESLPIQNGCPIENREYYYNDKEI